MNQWQQKALKDAIESVRTARFEISAAPGQLNQAADKALIEAIDNLTSIKAIDDAVRSERNTRRRMGF